MVDPERKARAVENTVNANGARMLAPLPPIVRDLRYTDATAFYEDRAGKTDALRAVRDMAERGFVHQRGRDRYCLCLTGEYGTGKTFLGTALYKQLVKRFLTEEAEAQYVGFDEARPWEGEFKSISSAHKTPDPEWVKFYSFVRAVQSAYHRTSDVTVEQVLNRYQKAAVLMLDDVGDLDVEVESEDRRRLLYEVLDYRNDYGLPTVLTTNLSLREFEGQFGGRTVQRVVEMAALVEMGGENLRLVQ